MYRWVVGVWILLTTFTNAFVGMPVDNIGEIIEHKQVLKNKPKNDEESLEAIQAYILKEMFFDPLLNDDDPMKDLLSDEEDEEDDFGVSSGMDMYKGMLSSEIANKFKGRDLLGLKRRYLNRGETLLQ